MGYFVLILWVALFTAGYLMPASYMQVKLTGEGFKPISKNPILRGFIVLMAVLLCTLCVMVLGFVFQFLGFILKVVSGFILSPLTLPFLS